jgi:hypothetical protein
MSHRSPTLIAIAGLALSAAVLAASPPAGDAAGPPGRLFVVQAVPGATYDVTVGTEDEQGAETGAVLGPFELGAGEHTVRFAPDDGETLTATVEVRAGADGDLVLHEPAEVGGAPVADTYWTPMGPVASGMARVLVAHTATVPPADVRVDGETVFENIANGEFAVADVPAGEHSAALVPAGTTRDPLLGPIDVDLPAGTIMMVYAVGTPRNGSMDVISHQEALATRAATPPREIPTGAAGLVRSPPVPFGHP